MNAKLFFLFLLFSFSSFAQLVPANLKSGPLFCTSEGENLNNFGWVQVKMKILIDPKSKKHKVELQSLLGFGGYECTDFCQEMKTEKMPYLIPLQFASLTDGPSSSVIHLFQTKNLPHKKIFVSLTEQPDGSLYSWTGHGDFPIGWYTPLRCHYL